MRLTAGQLWAFQAKDNFFADAPPPQRFGAMQVLGAHPDQAGWICVAVLARVWSQWPEVADTHKQPILVQNRFSHSDDLAVICLQPPAPAQMSALRLLGSAALPKDASGLLAGCRSYAQVEVLARIIEGEWRWQHDHAALMADHLVWQTAQTERKSFARDYQRNRLRGLTLAHLATETPLAAWPERFGVVDPDYTQAAQATLRDTIAKLGALGHKPARKAVRQILFDCIGWFNAAEGSFGYFIETEEREDLMAAVFEMAHAAGHPGLAAEFEAWRIW